MPEVGVGTPLDVHGLEFTEAEVGGTAGTDSPGAVGIQYAGKVVAQGMATG